MDDVTQRPIFILALRPEPHVDDVPRALRAVLKIALRQYGLKCVELKILKREDTISSLTA